MPAYIGFRKGRTKVFYSRKKPTQQSHPQYDAVQGPFKNKFVAETNRSYFYGGNER